MQFSHAEGYIHSQCMLQWSPVCIRCSHCVMLPYGSTTWNFPSEPLAFPGHPWSVIILLSLMKGSFFTSYSFTVYGNACMCSQYAVSNIIYNTWGRKTCSVLLQSESDYS